MTIAPLPNESPGKPDCYFVAYEGGIVFGVMTTAEGGGPSQDWKILCSPPILLESQEEKKKANWNLHNCLHLWFAPTVS